MAIANRRLPSRRKRNPGPVKTAIELFSRLASSAHDPKISGTISSFGSATAHCGHDCLSFGHACTLSWFLVGDNSSDWFPSVGSIRDCAFWHFVQSNCWFFFLNFKGGNIESIFSVIWFHQTMFRRQHRFVSAFKCVFVIYYRGQQQETMNRNNVKNEVVS